MCEAAAVKHSTLVYNPLFFFPQVGGTYSELTVESLIWEILH